MENLISYLTQESPGDVIVAGFIDSEKPLVFHPMYERLFFIFSDFNCVVYLDDEGFVKSHKINELKPWFDIDEDDRFSLMSIYSQLFKTENEIKVSKVECKKIPFSEMSITYSEGSLERVLILDPKNFFGFTFS